MTDKHTLRQVYLQKRHAFVNSTEHLQAAITGWSEQLALLIDLMTPKTIAAYLPMPGEATAIPFLQNSNSNFQILLPKKHQNDYVMVSWNGNDLELEPGPFGILQPLAEQVWEGDIDLWIVPCLAIDTLGHRLGMGKGIYDRLLANTKGLKVGLIYEWQMAPHLPADPWDIQLDMVITPEITTRVVG